MAEKRRRSCQDTQGALPSVSKLEVDSSVTVTLSGVCPEGESCSHLARPSLLHIILGQGQHDGFETNQSRRQENLPCRKDWFQLRRTALSEWMALHTQAVAAIFLCHLCEHLHSSNCTVVLRLFVPRFLQHHISFGRGVRDGLGPDQPRSRRNLFCRKDWIQLRGIARSVWAILPVQEVAAYTWCAECKLLRPVACRPLDCQNVKSSKQAPPLSSSCEGDNGVQMFLPFASGTRSTHGRQFDVSHGHHPT